MIHDAVGRLGKRCSASDKLAMPGRQSNERSGGILNRTQYPSDVVALAVPWRLRYRLTLRDLSEMFLPARPGVQP